MNRSKAVRFRGSQMAALALATALSLAGCGSGGSEPNAPGTDAAGPGGSTNPDARSGTRDAVANIEVCGLLTYDEVEELTGFVRSNENPEFNEGFDGSRICTWATSNPQRSLQMRFLQVTVWSSEYYHHGNVSVNRWLNRGDPEFDFTSEPLVDTDAIDGEVVYHEMHGLGLLVDDNLAVFVSAGGLSVDTSIEEQTTELAALIWVTGRLGVN